MRRTKGGASLRFAKHSSELERQPTARAAANSYSDSSRDLQKKDQLCRITSPKPRQRFQGVTIVSNTIQSKVEIFAITPVIRGAENPVELRWRLCEVNEENPTAKIVQVVPRTIIPFGWSSGGNDSNQTICGTLGTFRKSWRRSMHSDPRR